MRPLEYMDRKIIHIDNYHLDNFFNYGEGKYFYNDFLKESESISFFNEDKIIIECIEFDERNGSDFSIKIRNNSTPIHIKNCLFKKKVFIDGNGIGELIFKNVIFEGELNLNFDCKKLSFLNCENLFTLNADCRVKEEVRINKCNFINLKIGGEFFSRNNHRRLLR